MAPARSELVRPATARDGTWELRAVDFLWTSVPNVPFTLEFRGRTLDYVVLKRALALALDRFPILAGRVQSARKKRSAGVAGAPLCIDLAPQGAAQEAGALLELEDRRTGAFNSACEPGWQGLAHLVRAAANAVCAIVQGASRGGSDGGVALWDESLFPSNQAPLLFPHEPLLDFGPLFSAKVTLLSEEHCVLGVSFVHCVADAASVIKFLQTWSFYCASVAGASTRLPAALPPAPRLDRHYDMDEAALGARVAAHDTADASSSYCEFAKVLVKTVPTFVVDHVCDLVVQQRDVAALKASTSSELDPGEWVSTYEVLCAVLMRALAKTDAEQAGRAADAEAPPLMCRCAVNTRERGDLCGAEYFGNGVHMLPVTVKCGHVDNDKWLGETARCVHDQIRGALRDPEAIDALHYLSESGLRQGQFDSYVGRIRWTKIYSDTVTAPNTALFNSWAPFDWWGMDFGTGGVTPCRMHVSRRWSHRRYFLVFPRDATHSEMVVRVQLAKGDMVVFLRALREAGLRFERLEARRG